MASKQRHLRPVQPDPEEPENGEEGPQTSRWRWPFSSLVGAATVIVAVMSIIALVLVSYISSVNQSVIAGGRALQSEITEVREEIGEVRNDVEDVAQDVSDLRSEVGYIKGKVDATNSP